MTSVPEKYVVKGADGEIDTLATFRKVDEHRASLEKRLGTGDIRPKTAADYKMPENDAFKSLQIDDAQAKAFREKAHAWGLSQSQYEAVMTEWAERATGLVGGAAAASVDDTLTALRGTWKDEAEFDANMKGAYAAVNGLAEKAGISFKEVEDAIGNNPVAIRLFATLAGEMGEDATPKAAGGTGGQTDINTLMTHPAYSDARHPEHASISAKVKAYFDRQAVKVPA